MNKSLFIGLLSGTSMDAIDVALASFDPKPKLLAKLNYPFPPSFKADCLEMTTSGSGSIDDYCSLDVRAGELFAEAVLELLKRNNLSPQNIRAIGSHGQTIRHCPERNPAFSLQIGNPSVISERTGILTVADFRRADIAAGGQGAPLAPGFHDQAFRDSKENRVILNIGGISNITILNVDLKGSDNSINKSFGNSINNSIIGFDCGPGNCLMDSWAELHLNQPYDKDGLWGATGQIREELLAQFLSDPYFMKKPPKSTGREYFNLTWLEKNIQETSDATGARGSKNYEPQDIQATLLKLTTQAIVAAIQNYAPADSKVYVCGGGAFNKTLLKILSKDLGQVVRTTDIFGIAPEWVEAMLFAWLAKQTLEGNPGNCPSVTGAKRAVTLGGIFGFSKVVFEEGF